MVNNGEGEETMMGRIITVTLILLMLGALVFTINDHTENRELARELCIEHNGEIVASANTRCVIGNEIYEIVKLENGEMTLIK
jgi:hypothetical protein